MASEAKIPGTAEAWESGALGKDEKHVRRATAGTESKIDEALGLQAISIRLPKAVIETFKMLAGIHGVGYQPLMRDALCRFAEGEMKQLLVGQVEVERQKPRAGTAKPKATSADTGSTSVPAARRALKKAA